MNQTLIFPLSSHYWKNLQAIRMYLKEVGFKEGFYYGVSQSKVYIETATKSVTDYLYEDGAVDCAWSFKEVNGVIVPHKYPKFREVVTAFYLREFIKFNQKLLSTCCGIEAVEQISRQTDIYMRDLDSFFTNSSKSRSESSSRVNLLYDNIIANTRRTIGLSLKEMAILVGENTATICVWEKEKTQSYPPYIENYCNKFLELFRMSNLDKSVFMEKVKKMKQEFGKPYRKKEFL